MIDFVVLKCVNMAFLILSLIPIYFVKKKRFQVLVEIENRDMNDLSPAIENITSAPKKRKKVRIKEYSVQYLNVMQNVSFVSSIGQDSPSPIALEPCNGNRAAVLSLLVRLPTGEYLKRFKKML